MQLQDILEVIPQQKPRVGNTAVSSIFIDRHCINLRVQTQTATDVVNAIGEGQSLLILKAISELVAPPRMPLIENVVGKQGSLVHCLTVFLSLASAERFVP